MSDNVVIYHGGCTDGFTAAWCFYVMDPDATFWYGVHGKNKRPPEGVKGKDVYIVDFSYPLDVMEDLAKRARSVTILDHHASALPVEALIYSGTIKGKIDTSRSGAALAFEYVFGEDVEKPHLLSDVEDYDLWAWKRPNTAYTISALECYPHDFATWTRLMRYNGYSELVEAGKPIHAYKMKQAYDIAEKAWTIELAGKEVPAVNCPRFLINDVGNILAKNAPFSVMFFEGRDKVFYSLRSEGRVNCAEIAEEFGGGGHENAAGFVVDKE